MAYRASSRKRGSAIVVAAIWLGYGMPVWADGDARSEASAVAVMAAPSSITISNDLVLGTVSLNLATVQATGPRLSVNSGVIIAPSQSPAGVTIVGDPDQAVSLGIPREIDLSRVGGLEHLMIATSDLAEIGASSGNRVLKPNGSLMILIGARVFVARNAVPGDYRGVLATTVQYN